MLALYDLVCLSHLRWDFVYQRPQQLLGRCVRRHRVFFVEEPVFGDGPARLDLRRSEEGVYVVRPTTVISALPVGVEGTVTRLGVG